VESLSADSVKIILAENPLRETVSCAGPLDLESMFEAGNSMIEDIANAADSPTPIRTLEAAAKLSGRAASGHAAAEKGYERLRVLEPGSLRGLRQASFR
jgi:hypothetical protein